MSPRHLIFTLLTLVACGGPQECKLDDPKTCTGGMVCEKVDGKPPAVCFQPLMIQGTVKVFGAATATPIADAEIALLDANGAPIGAVGKTSSDGTFSLRLEATRSDAKTGTPIGRTITLRVAAQDFLPFPSLLRPAKAIDTSGAKAVSIDKPWIFASAQTDVTLAGLTDPEKNRPGVSGTIEGVAATPVLVAIEGGGKAYTTAPDSTGAFHVFNVLPGTYKAQAYAKGLNYTATDVTVASGTDSTGVSIKKATAAVTFTPMTGSIQLATGANGAGSSVALVLESSFDTVLVRGELVPGLRGPDTGVSNGTYTIGGIPDGKYVVLVGLDNDGNVRDPDPAISVSQQTHLTVTSGLPSANPVVKVVGATVIVSPGAADGIEEVAGIPTFKWKPYQAATGYTLTVFTATGVKTWERLGVLNTVDADGNIAVPYGGTTALKAGVIYQWRVASYNLFTPIGSTEDLRGLFVVK